MIDLWQTDASFPTGKSCMTLAGKKQLAEQAPGKVQKCQTASSLVLECQ